MMKQAVGRLIGRMLSAWLLFGLLCLPGDPTARGVRFCAVPRFEAGQAGAAGALAAHLKTARLMWGTGLDAESQGNATIRRAKRQYGAGEISLADEQAMICNGEQDIATGKDCLQAARFSSARAEKDRMELKAEPAAVVAALRSMCGGHEGPFAVDVAGYTDGACPGVARELEREGYRVVSLSAVVGRWAATGGASFVDKRTGKAVTLLVISQIYWADPAGAAITGSANLGHIHLYGVTELLHSPSGGKSGRSPAKPGHLGDGWLAYEMGTPSAALCRRLRM